MKTKDLVLMAMYVAMFAVLEYLGSTLAILQMPMGGSLSLSAIPLIMASYQLGFKRSLLVVFMSLFVKFTIKAPSIYHPIQFLMDYFVAYGAYSLAVLVKDVKVNNINLPLGVVLANFVRFMAHNVAGWAFFADGYPGNVLWGVVAYNTPYMLATTVVSFIFIMVIKPRLKKTI